MYNRVIYKSGKAIAFSAPEVSGIIEDEYYDKYSKADRNTIAKCVMHIAADLCVDDWECFEQDISPERHLTDAVMAYLEDNHSVYDLDNLEDETEIFDYLGCR